MTLTRGTPPCTPHMEVPPPGLNLIFMVRKIGQLFKIFKILIVPLFWLTIDDMSVMLSLDCIVMNFLCKLPLYYLTLYQNLLRSNFIFVVRKVGKISPWWWWWGGGGVCHPLQFSLCLMLEPSPYTVENLVCIKALPILKKKKCIHPSSLWPSKG